MDQLPSKLLKKKFSRRLATRQKTDVSKEKDKSSEIILNAEHFLGSLSKDKRPAEPA